MNDPMSYEEIGAELGITPERVRQIEATALRKLRANAEAMRISNLFADQSHPTGYTYPSCDTGDERRRVQPRRPPPWTPLTRLCAEVDACMAGRECEAEMWEEMLARVEDEEGSDA